MPHPRLCAILSIFIYLYISIDYGTICRFTTRQFWHTYCIYLPETVCRSAIMPPGLDGRRIGQSGAESLRHRRNANGFRAT